MEGDRYVEHDALVHALRGLGVREGGLIMVHASLRRLRPEGGADGLIQVLCDVLGPIGTVLMPLGAEPPGPFDPLGTPAQKEIGVLAEVFRQHEAVQVNDHVAGRFAAFGPAARALLAEPPLHDYLGPGSALERFTAADGQVLRLGADRDTVTLTHWAEYLADVPDKRRVRRHYVRADGSEQWIESLDDSEGIRDWPKGDYFSALLTAFIEGGHATVGEIGGCALELLPAPAFVAFAAAWMEREL